MSTYLQRTLQDLHDSIDPRVGLLHQVGDEICLLGFHALPDGRVRVDLSTVDGEDRTVLIDGDAGQPLTEVIALALSRHGEPSTWPVWASEPYAEMARALG